ncbi:MAG: RecB family exonuclease [Candidatus Zipacnadales bacterium]
MNSDPSFTAAMLEALDLCPMKYYLYAFGDAGGATRRVDAARALHAAVKHCLDECYRHGGPRHYSVERLQEEFQRSFEGTACVDSREEDEYRQVGLRILADYHADHCEDIFDGLLVDVALQGEIAGVRLRAWADRREGRSDGSIAYIQYTTGRRPPTTSSLQEDLRTGTLQLLAEQREGRPVEVEVHALRQRRILDATKPPDALASVETRICELSSRARNMRNPPALKGRHCRWCHVRSVCPAWAKP